MCILHLCFIYLCFFYLEEQFLILGVIDLSEFPGGNIKHAFADQLFLSLSEKLFVRLVKTDVAAILSLEEDRGRCCV